MGNIKDKSGLKINLFFPVLCLVLLFPVTGLAQSSFVKSIKKGLGFEYNFKWQQAEDIFQNLINEYPEDPRGYHYLAGIYLWHYLSNLDKKDFKDFVNYSDTAIAKGEQLMEDEHSNADLLYLMGADYSYRALAFTKAEKFLDAVWASKKSESYLNKALEADSTYYDAYLGLGLYNFAVGQIPATFRWALSLAGIHGSVDLGLSFIKIAADKGDLSRVEAQYYLSQILSDFLFQYDKAGVYLNNLVEKYPGNLLFNYSLAVLDIKSRKLTAAGKILTKIIAQQDTNFKQITAFSNFLMGDVLFKQNNFNLAKGFYISFINSTPDNDYLGIAYYRLGICYEITGSREDAVDSFKLTEKGNMDIEDDIFAVRRAKVCLKKPFGKNEIDLIKYSNLIDNGKYKVAFDSLSYLVGQLNNDTLKGEVYIGLSKAAFYMGLYKQSANFALAAKLIENNDESWIKPYACYYAARADKKLGIDTSVVNLVEEAKGYSDFDYQKKLKNKLYALTFKEKNDKN